MRIRAIDMMFVLGLVGLFVYGRYDRGPSDTKVEPGSFAEQVRFEPLDAVAVQADGRIRSLASHAKTYLGYVSGPRSINGQENRFSYLDLIFRPDANDDVDSIYVKNKLVREEIVDLIAARGDVPPARLQTMRKTGLIAPRWFREPTVMTLMQRLGQNLIKTAKSVDAIQSALNVSSPALLERELRIVPPPSGAMDEPWISIADVARAARAPMDDAHAGLAPQPIPGLDPNVQSELAGTWQALRAAWRNQDAAATNTAIEKFAGVLSTFSASPIYPEPDRLSLESWYFRSNSMTWIWFVYLAAVIPLLMSVIYRWNGARVVGLTLFMVAFGLQTASLIIRWYISGRWPNANMFEAVTTSAWFGGVLAIVLEYLARKTVFRNLFALGSAVMSMLALMAAYFLPATISSAIGNKMPALNDVWLYIHTNVIIWSYAVIGLACIPAILLLRHRWCKAWDEGGIPKIRLLLLPVAFVALNFCAYKLLMHVVGGPGFAMDRSMMIGVVGAGWGALLLLLLEAQTAIARRRVTGGLEKSASGGAASLMGATPGASSFLLGQPQKQKPSLGQVFDGATMVLVELAFIMLWTGTVMGAIWADHSWGRPWGWDPKEVFALNTFIVFLILLHVRLKVKDKAFWTAIIALVGFEVMMFNWIVVNFVITGLHSYA